MWFIQMMKSRTPVPCTRIHDRVPLACTQVDAENCQLPVSFWISKIGQSLREIWPKTSQKTKFRVQFPKFFWGRTPRPPRQNICSVTIAPIFLPFLGGGLAPNRTLQILNSHSSLNNGPICNPKPPLESWEALLFGQTVQIRVPLILS